MLSSSGKAVAVGAAVLVVLVAVVVLARRSDSATPGAPGTATTLASGSGEAPRSSSNLCQMSPCGNAACDACTNQNCMPATDGCRLFDDATDRKLCEDLYACITSPTNHCTNQGDPVRCWCGTNPTTCLGNESGPLAANGPCKQLVLAAGKTTDPSVLRARFVDAVFPLGRAVRLSSCRGSFCSAECAVP